MKRTTILTALVAAALALAPGASAQTWQPPTLPTHTGVPPADEPLYLYLAEKGMYLTNGTTWNTHAALTSDRTAALVYQRIDWGTYCQFHSEQAGGQGYLFNAESGYDVYTDYGVSDNPVTSTYWALQARPNGCFRIAIPEESNWGEARLGYCIGWDPDSEDRDNSGWGAGTNIGLFSLDPSGRGYVLDWTYYTVEDFARLEKRQTLYELLLQATDLNLSTDAAGQVYENASSSLADLQQAIIDLQTLINQATGGTTGIDVTDRLTNPNFDGNVRGWDVAMPGAQNKGYQGASYTNGSVSIARFCEGWIPSGSTLGAGTITQTLSGLPEGRYVLEADIIACNQATRELPTGVFLFADSQTRYAEAAATLPGQPQHFACEFIQVGSTLTIGLRTTATTTANWIAFDNVRLTYYGEVRSTASQVTVAPSALSLVVNETAQLTAQVTTSQALFDHVVWTSSNEQVATVDIDGRVTAHDAGTATITATAVASSVKATARVSIVRNDPTNLIFNEIQVANLDMFIDPSVNYGGWVEFYNPSSAGISLGGLYISDDEADLQKFQLPTDVGVVPAHGFQTLWFDHHDTGTDYSAEAYKQVDFKLGYEGGNLYLSDADGNLLLSQAYPPAISRASYARTTDGGDTWSYTSTPTPAATNVGSTFASSQLPAPVVSHDGTVFSTPFAFQVSIPAGATLRYTTDGSTPTLTNGTRSADGRFQLTTSNVAYRFRLFQDGFLPSPVVTRTFIYNNRDYYLPIVSVVTAEKNLYDNTIGAYVDGTNGTSGNNKSFSNKNRSWERPVNFEYLVPDADGNYTISAINQEVDFEVCGGWSRHWGPGSSFRLKSGKQYEGKNFLAYPVFGADKPYIKNKALQIRNGGNDSGCRIWDAAIHEVILKSGFYLDCQATQPAHIFINGQYRFMFNVREPNNKNLGYSNYGIDKDEMDQFEINGTDGYEQKVGDDRAFRQWMAAAQELAADPTNEALYQKVCELVDIDEYCNYMAAECYIGSTDWLTNCNNVKGFRSREDGKFHLVLMDVDAGFGWTDMVSRLPGSLNDGRYDTGHSFLIEIFLNMLKHEGFKKKFIDAYCLVAGSVFEPDRVRDIISGMATYSAPGLSLDGASPWNSANNLMNNITNTGNRANRISSLRNYFGLSRSYDVSLSSNLEGATLLVNGQRVPTGRFTGTLFAPATITAQAPAGYRFTGWKSEGVMTAQEEVFGTADAWYYYDQGSLDGQDWKATAYNASAWKNAAGPFGYGTVGIVAGAGDYRTTLDYGSRSSNKRPTYYFRKAITLAKPPTSDDIYRLTYYVDDGCVIYVNGTEVARYHMADGTPAYSDYSTTYEASQAYTATVTIDNSLLHAGENVIAVEVHNCSATSSDIYWGAALVRGTFSTLVADEELSLDALDAAGTLSLVAQYERMPDEELIDAIAMPIKVNEVSAANSVYIGDVYKKNDWLELYNTTDTDLNVAGLYLSDDLNDPLKYQIPSGTALNTIVPAFGHLILWADKLDPVTQLHTNFKLGNNDGEMVLVTTSDEFVQNNAAYFAAHPGLKNFADALVYSAHAGDQSVGRFPDGGNTFYRMTHPTIERSNERVSYDEVVGVDEGIMHRNDYTFTLTLDEGWNWVSHPLQEPLAVNEFKDAADRILGQTLEATYSSTSKTMEGTLKELATGELYKMDMDKAATYQFDGRLPLTIEPLQLKRGWNWIGYPAAGIQTLQAAFENAIVDVGDILLGQHGFAIFHGQQGWIGTLSSLVPGDGYMYKARRNKSFQISQAPDALKLRKRLGRGPQATRFDFDSRRYPDVMGIVAQLQLDGEAVDAELFDVAAYAGEECRGAAQVAGGLLFLTLYGVEGDALTFKAYDQNGEDYTVEETQQFASDVVGTLSVPITLHLKGNKTDIAPVTAPSAPVGYYTLSGLFAGRQASTLRPGLYIMRQSDGGCRKVYIR